MRASDRPATALSMALVVLSAAAACGGDGGTSAAVEQGRQIYQRICANCHGRDAGGVPALGKGLRANDFTRSRSDSELVEFLTVGRSAGDPLNDTGIDMPPNGGDLSITEEELRAVVAFLRTL